MKLSNHVSKITVGKKKFEGEMFWLDLKKLLMNKTKK